MEEYEKAKRLLGREPTDSDEPFESLNGWRDTATVEVEPDDNSTKKKAKKKKGT